MENHPVKHILKWVYFLSIFAGFSIQSGLSKDVLFTGFSRAEAAKGTDPVIFSFGCINGEPGDTICIPVTVENFNDIVIAQFEITWNSDVLDYIEISNPGSPSINVNADFNLSGPNALKFIPLGFPIDGESLPDGTVLFEICFRIIGFPTSTSCVGISPYFDFEVADVNGVVPSDSVNCCMTVQNAGNLVGFVTSCGPAVLGGNGVIDITAYGGQAPYTITGVPGGPFVIPVEGGSIAVSAPAGNYNVMLTDGAGNAVMYPTNVSTLALGITTHVKDPTCFKFSNGTIWIKPEGGTEPYSYIWNSLTDPNLAGSGFIRHLGDSSLVTSLPDGMYSILVEDINGCQTQVIVTLLDNPFVFTINNLIQASCVGAEDGLIDMDISGATPDIDGNYTISGNLTGTPFSITSNSVTFGLLDPGDYQITVSDNVSQCDTIFEFSIGYSDTISASFTVTDPPCSDGVNGSLSIRGRTNGIPGPSYSYTIYQNGNQVTSVNNIGGTFNYSPLAPGAYVVIVREGSCKSDSIHFTVNQPPPILVTVVGSRPDNCIPTPAGDIWFSISNGVGPYTLDAGAGFQDADTLFNLNSGNYTLTVTDDVTGCTATLPFTIDPGDINEEADISFQINGTPCDGGTVTVLYQGAPIPMGVGVSWSNGMAVPTIPITESDTLSVNVIIGAPVFCILTDTVQIRCTQQLDLDITVQQPLCGEGANGGPYTATVIVDTANAVPPVTWYWSIPDTTTIGIYTGLGPGKYYVTVTDGLDSTVVDSFEVIAPNSLTLNFTNIDSTSCPETCDGSVSIFPGGGDPSLDYQLYWGGPLNPQADTGVFFNIPDLCAGLNIFNVSQDGLCFYPDTVEILAPDSVDIALVRAIDATCYGDQDGLIEVTGSGGTPGYTYQWQNGPMSAVNTGIGAGQYQVTITDSHNCSTVDSFSIAQPDTLIADIDSSGTLNLSCGNSSDGIITLNVSGGNAGGYDFVWNPDVSASYQAVNLQAGTYYVTVTDSKGCMDTVSYVLTSPLPITVDWPVVAEPECYGDETVLLIEDVSGGNGNYSFTINSGDLYEIGEPVLLPSGIYIVTVFDDRGCSTDTTYIIMEPDPILVSISPDDAVVDLGDSIYITGHVDQSNNPIAMTLWTSAEPMSCPTCESTWVFNSSPAEYTWTVTDINGCQGSATLFVDVDYQRDVYIPNIFSPNGDGRNDDFRVFTGPGVVSINYIQIYDRWGNLIHVEGQQLPSPTGAGNWDGTFKQKELNPGVYVYVVEITFVDNNTTLTYRGDVTLVR